MIKHTDQVHGAYYYGTDYDYDYDYSVLFRYYLSSFAEVSFA